jgi:OmpA-OmpF porin, OOP family
MSQNLVETVKNYFTGDVVRQASAAVGESETGVGAAMGGVIPLVLASLLNRAEQPGGSTALWGMAREAYEGGTLTNPAALLGADGTGGSSWLSRGGELLRSALGDRYASTTDTIATTTGVKSSSVSSLLGMAVPVVLGLLGRHSAENSLDANGFGNFLAGQKASVMSALPFGLGSLFSGGSSMPGGVAPGSAATAASTTFANAARTADRTADVVERAAPSRWPWLLLLLLAAATAWYFLRSNRTPDTATPVATETAMDTTTTAAAVPVAAPTGRYDAASGNYLYEVGSPTELKLPDGTVLNVGASSVESRLYAFLNDPAQMVSDDKTQGWMSFDRLYFATGKSTLTPESQAQLRNIAAILKAFPGAELKMGGYTDNTGKADANLVLSADRANAAMKSLGGMGVAASRVKAEGYGQEHPIAPNDTPGGRAQNRRIDVRVTKK